MYWCCSLERCPLPEAAVERYRLSFVADAVSRVEARTTTRKQVPYERSGVPATDVLSVYC